MKRLSAKKKFQVHQKILKKAKQDPVTLYLNGLAPTGRRSVRSLLSTAAMRLGFNETLEQLPWYLLEYQHLEQIKTLMLADGLSVNSVNLTIAGFKGVMSACFELGLVSAEELMRIKNVKRSRGKRLSKGRCLTKGEIRKIVTKCRKNTSTTGIRNFAIIALMLASGLRRSEIVQLNRTDYDARSGELRVVSGKGGKGRQLYLPAAARKQLRPWLTERGSHDGPLFSTISYGEIVNMPMVDYGIYRIVRETAEIAGIHKVSPHDLRRTFITRLLEGGVDINSVRQLAGHASIETTALYDKRGDGERRKAMKLIAAIC